MDDNEDTGEMYATGLSYAGFAPVVARTALEGLQLAGETSPDVIITDVMLPGPIDGLMLRRRLRGDERTRDMGIIIVTGRAFESDREDAREAGCDVFLTKPCLPDQLAAEVSRLTARGATPFGRQLFNH